VAEHAVLENQLLSSAPAGTLNLGSGNLGSGSTAEYDTRCLVLPVPDEAALLSPPKPLPPKPAHVQPQPARPRATNSSDPWVGHTIRDYVIEDLLGAGAMGRVYRARHRWLDMQVALKIMKEELYDDESCVARFRREATAVARLNHPNIVRAFDGGMEGHTLFLVTEFVLGQNLSTLLQTNDLLSIADVCEIICQAAAALQHAHEQGMVHRDIKPSNMMFSANGRVKLLDLGLARFAQGHATLTETGHVMGTLDFMAPEQAGDSRHVDIRADIYSLGCTLYCLLTGVPPFTGPAFDTPVSKMLAHSDSEPPAVSLRRPKVPAAVLQCLQKMMAKSRDDRYSCPAEVIQALQPFTAQSRLATLSSGQPSERIVYQATDSSTLTSKIDWLADVVFDNAWVVLRTQFLIVGLLERRQLPGSPISKVPGKTVYDLSPKGVAAAIVLIGLIAFLYASGFRIYFY
jgi:serine/threonine protein kinase